MDLGKTGSFQESSSSVGVEDQQLLSEIARRDTDAFRAIFERYAPVARALIARILPERQLAEEVMVEAFRDVWESPEAYRGEGRTVRSLIMGAVHRRAIERARLPQVSSRAAATTSRPVSAVITALPPVPDPTGHPDTVRSALERLPQEQRDVIELMYFGGLSVRDVSVRLGVSVRDVTVRCRAAMGDLRRELLPPSEIYGSLQPTIGRPMFLRHRSLKS